MTPEEILQLYIYTLEEAGEGQYLHDPDSAGSGMARLWQDIVRAHCPDVEITTAINDLIRESYKLALANFEAQLGLLLESP